MLVEEAGGKCQKCGYNKSIWALSFHHNDPTEKDFGLSTGGLSRDIDFCDKKLKNVHYYVLIVMRKNIKNWHEKVILILK